MDGQKLFLIALEDRNKWRDKNMELGEFRTKARDALSCSNMGTTEEEMSIWAVFEQPLRKEYNFSVQDNGTFRMYSRAIGSGIVCKLGLTSEHQQSYLGVLYGKISAYRSIVERNRQTNRHYQIPQLELEQAQEMAAEALRESFGPVKQSYKSLDSFRNTKKSTNLETAVKAEEPVRK